MKIAIVTETFMPNTDGIVTRLVATIDWLLDQGHEVTIISPELGLEQYRGADIIGMPARPFFLYRDKKLAFPTRKVGQALKQLDPDIVHVVNPAVLGVAGIYYSRRQKRPLVASYHTNIPQYADYYRLPFLKPVLWWYLRKLHNKADLNLCTSEAVRQELTAQKFRNVKLWDRGVASQQFSPDHFSQDMRDQLTERRNERTLLLYVGRLAAEKEIQKIREVLEQSDQFCLAIVGDGPYRATLEEHFAGTATVFTGFMHGQDLSAAYASADAFVFPSTTETLGLVILEAMASGLPVVAARSGPTAEQVVDEQNGLLYDPLQRGDFASTVLKLTDEPLRKYMANEAYRIGQGLDWSRPSRQVCGFYEELLAQRKCD